MLGYFEKTPGYNTRNKDVSLSLTHLYLPYASARFSHLATHDHAGGCRGPQKATQGPKDHEANALDIGFYLALLIHGWTTPMAGWG